MDNPTVSNIQSGPAAPSASPAVAHERIEHTPVGTFYIRGVAIVTDARGRKIGIRKLSPLDRVRLFEGLGPKLAENMMYLSYALTCASVTSIDSLERHFPHSKEQVEQTLGLLDQDGFDAANKGYKEHFEAGETGDPEAIKK
jgi:hypothetical protein